MKPVYKYEVSFTGRNAGAIGFTHPHTLHIELPEPVIALDDMRALLYENGYEHITSLQVKES